MKVDVYADERGVSGRIALNNAPPRLPRAEFDRRRSRRLAADGGLHDRRGEMLPSVNPWADLDLAIDLRLVGGYDMIGPCWARLSAFARLCLWVDHRNRHGPDVWRVPTVMDAGLHRAIPPGDLAVLVHEAKITLYRLMEQRAASQPTIHPEKEHDRV